MLLGDLARISLKSKMITLVLVPLIGLIIVTGLFLNQSVEKFLFSKKIIKNLVFLEKVHYLVDDLQVERGLSNAYIAGANNFEKLFSQRKKVDENIVQMNSFRGKSFLINAASKIYDSIDALKTFRDLVDAKQISNKENIKNYSQIIKTLLDYYLDISGQSEKLSFGKNISSLRILEEAKEYEGRLRATLSAIFAADVATTQVEIGSVVALYTGVQSNLNSPLISLSMGPEEKLSNFKTRNHWKYVDEKYNVFLSKTSIGGYNVDSMEFFSEISKCVSDLNEIVLDYIQTLKANADILAGKTLWKLTNTLLMIVILTTFLILLLIFFIRSINGPMFKITKSLFDSSQEVNSAAEHISDASQLLAESANKQADSIEQTTSALEELSGIVKNNTASAEGSHKNANEVEAITKDALSVGNELVLAMEAVLKSNTDIQGLIKIINGIAEKVKIIDEIVFQTKLLSFNASIEAERAGEYGRGFSVVSHEIANLAQVSGKSAADIFSILKESTSKVEEITKNNTKHVEQGNTQVEKTRKILLEIEVYAKKVQESTLQVMQSSTEQNTGISQISKSMSRLDEVTQSNAATSEQAASSSEELSAQVESLNNTIRDLYLLVMGKQFVENQDR